MRDDLKTLIDIESKEGEQGEIRHVFIENIRPNPYQPRKQIDLEKVQELAQSVRTYGLLQPVIVRESHQHDYELVAGHRRLMACQILGWSEIPAIVKRLSNSGMATVALIENLQRENLTFLEEALAYDKILQEFKPKVTQEVLAQRLGKSQSTIANKLRLLKLPELVKEKLVADEVTERHARALLKLPDEHAQLRVLQEVINLQYTVQQTEKRVADYLLKLNPPPSKERRKVIIQDVRIFLNTVRQAASILEAGGVAIKIMEQDLGENIEITISMSKQKKRSEKFLAAPAKAVIN
ncbi:MAG: nucleoid occlusion protein [Dethiobacter sp.]|nr:nucleoid occlusion protein [Dethiobacter sp.]MBS3901912.1 nucleoid occlusion protein [Dethiobacter sp.]MBS3988816.1 nucleoid occlusion protein [Dethiobacter sp.]